ncbi:putative cyclin-A3-1 [Impatiens glandulifera]|uniref:putative cyclin-A3-1 n=1 Tax=Impatiens glandulifera TaxID=253017 RepID=UPI001FB11679|nr:putative cyclin-A3-1 [Impatiens glandulifera]
MENPVRVTRLAKKRGAELISGNNEQHQPNIKNRVILGEISNLSKVPNPKKKPNLKSKKAVITTILDESVGEIDSKPDDPRICNAYVIDIYKYLHNMEIEEKRRPLPDYIEKIQNDINSNMRSLLVDWLVEVADEYNLLPDTLYLTISYIDRFLSANIINRNKLQLLGVSSMLIATKFEEIDPPRINEFCNITDNTYYKEEIVQMETDILKCLNYEISNPTIKTFLRKFISIAQEDYYKKPNLDLEFLGCFLAELTLLDYDCVKFLPSKIASSVVFLSLFTLRPDQHPWNSALEKYTGYKAADLKECSLIIQDLQIGKRGGGSLVAIRDKYKQHKFKHVSTLTCSCEVPSYYFEEIQH